MKILIHSRIALTAILRLNKYTQKGQRILMLQKETLEPIGAFAVLTA